MALPPSIQDTARRNILPSANFAPRAASGADFGGQVGAALQGAGQALQGVADARERAELLRLQDQKALRNFTLQTNLIEFEGEQAEALASAADNIPAGGWEFQRGFMGGFDATAQTWLEQNGITEESDPEEYARYQAQLMQTRRSLSAQALQAETAERNRFYTERTADALSSLSTRIDENPDNFEAIVDQGSRLIEGWPIGEARKEQLSNEWQQQAALAYGNALLQRDPTYLSAVLGGNVPVVGDYQGPTAGEPKADYDFFRSQGFSDTASAAILGVLSWESGGGENGINPNGRNPGDGNDGSDSIGAAQWNAERADALKAFAQARGKPWTDKATQLEFVVHELRTTEPEAYRRLMAAQTIEDAVEAMSYYERPQGWTNGGDRESVIHWRERVERAKHFAGEVVTEATAGAVEPDPRLANLPYAQRLQLREAAERKVQQVIQMEARQQQQNHEAQLNGLLVGLADGTLGQADVDAARAAGWLTDFDEISRANNVVAERNRDNADINLFNTLWSDNATVWNPYDDDQKKAVDAAFTRAPTLANLQTIADRTGIVPPAAASFLRGQLLSTEPENVEASARVLSGLLARNPNALAPVEGRQDLEDAALTYDTMVNDLGFTGAQAAQAIAQENDPRVRRERQQNRERVSSFRTKTGRDTDVGGLLRDLEGPNPRILNPYQSSAFKADFVDLAAYYFERNGGDEATALATARRRIGQLYGVSNGTLIKYPPEKGYPAVDGNHRYVYEQASGVIQQQSGRVVEPRDIYFLPVPTLTAEAWRRGAAIPYAVFYRYQNEQGQTVYDTVPGAFMADPSPAAIRLSNERRAQFQGAEAFRRDQRIVREAVPAAAALGGAGGPVF